MSTTKQTFINRNYKDRLFRFIFNDKKELLDLYNAINGTQYDNEQELTINTIDNVIYMGMKNDVSFLISGVLNLYEHQSTWNPNMAYRNFIYTAELFRSYVKQHHLDIYGSRQICLPMPKSIVFYNGKKKIPERSYLKLSDSFLVQSDCSSLEFKTLVLNINYGKNKELMNRCKRLREYAIFVDKVQFYIDKNNSLEKAANYAIAECINEQVLSDVLIKHKNEVLNMILEEYDEQEHIANEKRWSREQGRMETIIEQTYKKMQKGKTPQIIANEVEEEKELIEKICDLIRQSTSDYDVEKIYEAMVKYQ